MKNIIKILAIFIFYIAGIISLSQKIKEYKQTKKNIQDLMYKKEAQSLIDSLNPKDKKTILIQSKKYEEIAQLLEKNHLEQTSHNKNSDRLIKAILYSFFGSDLFFTKSDYYFLKEKHSYNKIYDDGGIVLYKDLKNIITKRSIKIIDAIKKQSIILNQDQRSMYFNDKITLNKNEDFIINEYTKLIKKKIILLYIDFIEKHPNEPKQKLLKKATSIIKKDFIDKYSELLNEDLNFYYKNIIDGLAISYDSHSKYLDKNEIKEFYSSLDGSFDGIGLILDKDLYIDRYVIKDIVKGSPADRSQLINKKDIIISIKDLKNNDFIDLSTSIQDYKFYSKMIKANSGYPIELTLKTTEGFTKTVLLIREYITPEDSRLSYMIYQDKKTNNKIGYIKIPAFYGRTSMPNVSMDFIEAINILKKNKVEGLMLDLRDNPGGLLDEAVKISSLFITSNPIVQLKYPKNMISIINSYISNKKPYFSKPLVIMINSSSASAAEILSGALQNYNKGIIIGSSQSFGKGTVQSIIQLPYAINEHNEYESRGALVVTSQKFYKADGHTNQYLGIIPDILIQFPTAKHKLEKNDEFSLPFDTITTAKFKADIKNIKIKNIIFKNSKIRLANHKQLNLYKKLMIDFDTENKNFNTLSELQLNAFFKKTKELELINDKLFENECTKLKCERFSILKEKGLIEDNLFKNFIFQESANVLIDMVKNGY